MVQSVNTCRYTNLGCVVRYSRAVSEKTVTSRSHFHGYDKDLGVFLEENKLEKTHNLFNVSTKVYTS
jgi:hypothetical protein